MTSKDLLHDGDRIRVKVNMYTRRYGVRCHSSINPADDHLAPGEIGTVKRGSYKCGTGEMVGHWIIEFSRGRTVTLSCENASADSDVAWFLLDSEGEDFRMYKK
jgi:hypothetical protein